MRSHLLTTAISCFFFSTVACGSGGDSESLTGTTTTTAPAETALVAEVGFIDIGPQPTAANYAGRLFYSFHPAETVPEKAPLIVFFNGGPGRATSGLLMAFGTGPTTMTVEMAIGDQPVENADRLSRFANLLYIDARQTGFSYGLSGPSAGCVGSPDVVLDSGDFVFALLDFMDARPALRDAPVVLFGESYGGARSATMLHLLQHYADEELTPSMPDPARIAWLRDRVQTHFDKVFATRAGDVFTSKDVASQFGWQVLVQPSIAGEAQSDLEAPLLADDQILATYLKAGSPCRYDVRITWDECARRDALGSQTAVDPVGFQAFTGVAPGDVKGLGPADRQVAFRAPPKTSIPPEATADLRALLGELGQDDFYWAQMVWPCGTWLGDVETLNAFVAELRDTRTFVTRARYDVVVYSPALPLILELPGVQAELDDTPEDGVERPGRIRISYPSGETAEIRFPAYEAGHMVTWTHAHELSADVESWLRETGAVVE